MNEHDDIATLRNLARDTTTKGHGVRLRKALLVLAIPASAAFATACYGVPMAEPAYHVTYGELTGDGVDCDGDGVADVADPESCGSVVPAGKQ